MKAYYYCLPSLLVTPNVVVAFVVPRWGSSRTIQYGSMLKAEQQKNGDDDDIRELYKTVAEQDPEWYQEFIANVLQEDLLAEPELAAAAEETKDRDETSDAPPSMKVETTKEKTMPETTKEQAMSETVKEKTVAKIDIIKAEIVIEDEVIVDDELVMETIEAQIVQGADPVDDLQDDSRSVEVQQDVPELVNAQKKDNVTEIPYYEDANDDMADDELTVSASDAKNEQAVDDVDNDEVELAEAKVDATEPEVPYYEGEYDDMANDELTVSALDVKDNEVLDDVEVIQLKALDEVDELQKEETYDDVLSNDEIDLMVKSTLQEAQEEIDHETGEIDSMLDSAVQSVAPQEENDNEPAATQPTVDVTNSTASGEPSLLNVDNSGPPTVVVYRDLYSGSLLAAPLRALTKLGYTTEDISFLQPDALTLILEDNIGKPQRGVPQQWRMSPSQKKILPDDVRLVTKDQAKEILKSIKPKKSPPVAEIKEEIEEEIEEEMEVPRRRRRKRRPIVDPDIGASEEQMRERPRRRPQPDERSSKRRPAQPIPNVKSSTNEGRGDPPNPVNPVWVDINTFRDLLRKEAELRVSILGDGWKDTVKKESKWRLDLYKEWLWSLSEGVGDPVIESRVPPLARRPRDVPPPPRRSRDVPPPRARRRDDGVPRRREAPPRREAGSNRDGERQIMDPRNPAKRRSTDGQRRSAERPRTSRRLDDDEYY